MAATHEDGEASGSAAHPCAEASLDELLRSLNIKGEDIGGEGICIEGGGEDAKGETKWMAVMCLLTSKPFNATSLKETMRFS
jgi:hypothetical protein